MLVDIGGSGCRDGCQKCWLNSVVGVEVVWKW